MILGTSGNLFSFCGSFPFCMSPLYLEIRSVVLCPVFCQMADVGFGENSACAAGRVPRHNVG